MLPLIQVTAAFPFAKPFVEPIIGESTFSSEVKIKIEAIILNKHQVIIRPVDISREMEEDTIFLDCIL